MSESFETGQWSVSQSWVSHSLLLQYCAAAAACWHVGRGLWVMHDDCSMTRSKVKVKVMSPWKLEILPFSKAIFSAIYNGRWQLTTDS